MVDRKEGKGDLYQMKNRKLFTLKLEFEVGGDLAEESTASIQRQYPSGTAEGLRQATQ